MRPKEIWERFFLVHQCGGCRKILAYDHFQDAFCPECRLRWHRAKTESCSVCFQSAIECTCMPKELCRTGMLCLRKLIFYRERRRKEPQNRLIYFLKKHPNRRMFRFLAGELLPLAEAELSALGLGEKKEEAVLVPIPRGRKGRAEYGFDQAEFLCAELSRCLAVSVSPVIKRHLGGKEQKKMDRRNRFRNIRHLFWVSDVSAVRGKCVLLVDDIVTTGASMAACTELLQKAGARAVIGLCMAQTP